jgi:hypothetical protein
MKRTCVIFLDFSINFVSSYIGFVHGELMSRRIH